MARNSVILKITNEKIWFNEHDFVPIESTNIPKKHMSFSYQNEIYWKVRQNSFDEESNTLEVTVEDYYANEKDFDNPPPKKIIHYLYFTPFDWEKLEKQLMNFQLSELGSILYNLTSIEENLEAIPFDNADNSIDLSEPKYYKRTTEKPKKFDRFEYTPYSHSEVFTIDFKYLNFHDGYLSFKKAFIFNNQIIEIKINNEHSKKEFQHVKAWFAKKLIAKKIKVRVQFELVDRTVKSYTALSKEIDSINQEMIDRVRVDRTLGLSGRSKRKNKEKLLSTIDTLFDEDNKESNVFNQSDGEIVKLLIENNEIRNHLELSYLADNKQDKYEKIRFTNHTAFGFVFFVKSSAANHFVWELLNSNATYIWSTKKINQSIEWQFQQVEEEIRKIAKIGRNQYKRDYKDTRESNLIFNRIEHGKKDSDTIVGFKVWKEQLNSLTI